MSTDSLLLVLLVVDIISEVLSTQTAKSACNNECGKLLFVYESLLYVIMTTLLQWLHFDKIWDITFSSLSLSSSLNFCVRQSVPPLLSFPVKAVRHLLADHYRMSKGRERERECVCTVVWRCLVMCVKNCILVLYIWCMGWCLWYHCIREGLYGVLFARACVRVCLLELVKDKIGAVKVFLELTLRVFDSISIGVTNGTLPYTCTLCVHLSASVHACRILAGGRRRRGLHSRIIVKFVPPVLLIEIAALNLFTFIH